MDDKKKKITLGILMFVMAAVWYSVLGSPDFLFSVKAKKKQAVSTQKNKGGIVNDETVKIILAKYQKKSTQHFDFKAYQPLAKIDMADVLEYRDPFKITEDNKKPLKKKINPSRVKRKSGPTLILQGIIWDENQPNAVINGEIVAKGDNIRGFIVQEIKKDRVVLMKNGKKKLLWEP